MTRTPWPVLAAVLAALVAAPAAAQDDGAAADADAPEGREKLQDFDTAPVIIKQRAHDETAVETPPELLSADQAWVQLRGTWVGNGTCAPSAGDDGRGLVVTDTQILWNGTACAVREVETSAEGEATVQAQCAINGERVPRIFRWVVEGDSLTMRYRDDGAWRDAALTRCPK